MRAQAFKEIYGIYIYVSAWNYSLHWIQVQGKFFDFHISSTILYNVKQNYFTCNLISWQNKSFGIIFSVYNNTTT